MIGSGRDGTDLPLDDVVREAARVLTAAGVPSPHADAIALAAHALGCADEEVRRRMLLGHTVDTDWRRAYGTLVGERSHRIPLQHLTGVAAFRHLTLRVGPGVFVPRPETEVVAQAAIDEAIACGPEPLVVDLCTGSGAIGLAVASEVPGVRVIGVEIDALAIGWAEGNRDATALELELVHADAASALPELEGTVDVVVSNPPYIPDGMEPVDPEVRDHDPAVALYGGSDDGLRIPLAVGATAARLLRPGGLLVMEHADSHGRSLPERLERTGVWREVADHLDLAGRPRFVTARRR
ncbi:peptide chain release factor N(5)-glutamine methyltransferase [Nostocoides sp. F2B08]|uniref:peptide chain release factor N(5)-glutamine methyltransferase n=1 Tax=Nostocoides sp. F2B08 TaxID=2653936 RepID=UPI001D05B979|nr:peptide chain release factor N(5)-glutamine methyltransferase [Tetrasphaera sp. F2B08]